MGLFPRQPNGPTSLDENSEVQAVPYATGKKIGDLHLNLMHSGW